MKPKRLISLLVAVCMMITMLPLSAVTAFAVEPWSDDPTADDGVYKYAYKVNEDGSNTATITKFLGPVDSKNTGPYNITIPTELDEIPTAMGLSPPQLKKVCQPELICLMLAITWPL